MNFAGVEIDTGVMAVIVVVAAVVMAISAAIVLARGAEEKDLTNRLRGVTRPQGLQDDAALAAAGGAVAPLRKLGEALRNTALVSPKDIEEFQLSIAAAGLNARAAIPVFIGVKAVLLIGLPLLGVLYGIVNGMEGPKIAIAALVGIFFSVFGPNLFLTYLKRKHQESLRKGLPDALDLLVVTAEAGLGIETALDRVAREMENTNRPIAISFMVLVQELRMLPDRRQALERFAQRTDFEGFRRLAGTLAQTLKYGTPLAQALRVLAAEMRNDRMIRIEEKAIRLPALLVIPLILFIMPAVFIALVGPSVIELSKGLFQGIQQ